MGRPLCALRRGLRRKPKAARRRKVWSILKGDKPFGDRQFRSSVMNVTNVKAQVTDGNDKGTCKVVQGACW